MRPWPYALATAQLQYLDGRTIYRLSGVVTAGQWPELVAEHARRIAAGPAPRSTLFDLTRAALSLTPTYMVEVILAEPRICSGPTWPVAILGNEVNAPILREYAWLMAQHGLLRGVFTDALRAGVWLELQEQVMEEERARQQAAPRPRTRRAGP